MRKALLFLGIAAVFVSCETDQLPSWTPEIFGPLVKMKVTLEDISELEDISFDRRVKGSDISSNWSGTVPSIPAGNYDSSRSFYLEVSEHFELVSADTLIFQMFFNNALPVNIKRGTQVAFYNTDPQKTEQQNFIFRYTIDRDVDPNDTFFLEQLLTDVEVTDDIRFRLENFQTDGSRRPVNFDSSAVIDFTFNLVFLKLNSVIIKAPESYSVSDRSDWNFNDGEEAKGKAEGELNFWLTNSLPVEFEVQFYLEDDAGNVLDSIFAERVDLPGAPYNSTIDEVVGEIDTSYLFLLNDGRIDTLTQATKLRTEFFVATPTEDINGIPLQSLNITMKETSSLDIQVVADVKVDVNAAIEDN